MKYLCVNTCFNGSRYRQGKEYEFAKNPGKNFRCLEAKKVVRKPKATVKMQAKEEE